MNIFSWINWFIIHSYAVKLTLSAKSAFYAVADGDKRSVEQGNLFREKSVRYGVTGSAGIRGQKDGNDRRSIAAVPFLFSKLNYVAATMNLVDFGTTLSDFAERIAFYASTKPKTNLKNKVASSVIISSWFLMNSYDKAGTNDVSRMGLALSTTASICLDYRLQEAFQTDIDACHQRSSAKLGKLCAENGGLYIKAAQHLASMDHLLPKSYINELSQLQDQAPISPVDVIEKVFKEEIGKELGEVFSDFCDVPIGSASIGQVHLARLRSTGEQVALKIQHPNIKSDSEIDLKAFKIALRVIKTVFPSVNFDWIVEELRNCLDSELNFKLEAENSKKAKIAFSKDPKFSKIVLIPDVYDEFTTERILTMKFISGFKINDIERMKSSGLDLNKVNKLMYQVFMEMIFKHQFVHCDPHPGNVLVNFDDKESGDIKIVLLDHGIYKNVPNDIVTKFSRLFIAILEKNYEEMAQLSVELNISIEFLEEFRNLIKTMSETLRSDTKSMNPIELNKKIREEVTKFIKKQPEAKKRQASEALQSIPREMLFIIRILDLLRSNERNLTRDSVKTMVPESLMVITNYCLKQVRGQEDSSMTQMVTYYKLMRAFVDIKMGSVAQEETNNNIDNNS